MSMITNKGLYLWQSRDDALLNYFCLQPNNLTKYNLPDTITVYYSKNNDVFLRISPECRSHDIIDAKLPVNLARLLTGAIEWRVYGLEFDSIAFDKASFIDIIERDSVESPFPDTAYIARIQDIINTISPQDLNNTVSDYTTYLDAYLVANNRTPWSFFEWLDRRES